MHVDCILGRRRQVLDCDWHGKARKGLPFLVGDSPEQRRYLWETKNRTKFHTKLLDECILRGGPGSFITTVDNGPVIAHTTAA